MSAVNWLTINATYQTPKSACVDKYITFLFYHFSQASGCTGCRCMHEQALQSAVVIKQPIPPSLADEIDDLEIELFYFDGCCKCENRGW